MKLLKNFICIALMSMAMGACDWYSDPLELVYPGTDLSGNKDDNKESELIKDVEQVLATSADEVWKITKETLNPQLHSRSATYIKRNGLLIRKITIKSSRPFQCAYHPLTP